MKESKKVVFVAANPINPDPRAEKQMVSLSKLGYEVMAIGWDRDSNKDTEGLVKEKFYIYRKGIESGFGNGIRNIIPLLKWQFFLFILLFKFRKRYEIIHVANFDCILPSLLIKYFFNKKVVYDIYDFYVDSFPVPKKLKKLVQSLDYWAISKSDAIILPAEYRLEQINQSNYKKIAFIHNTPAEMNLNIKHNNLVDENKLNIVYVGILQHYRFLKEMIQIVKNNQHFVLHLAGFGSKQSELLEEIGNSPNIHFYGKVNYEKGLELSSMADVLFCIYDPMIPNHKYSAPNKMYEAMLLGKPLIVAKGTGIDKIIEQEKNGIIVEYSKPEQVEKALNYLLANKEIREKMGRNSKKAYKEKYSWDIMEKRLFELYQEL